MAIDQAALILLEGNALAQRLVVTWPGAYAAWKAQKAGKDKQSVEQIWAQHTGIAHGEHAMMMLRANGLCAEDGTSDPQALAYVRAMIAKSLPKPKAAK